MSRDVRQGNTLYRKIRPGARVRSFRPMRNGFGEMPEGTLYTVTGKHGGLHLKADPCDCCGFRFSITKVRDGVTLVGDPDPKAAR